MKYPQLVSFKTIHEISDWLVKRLEDLEIEEQADHYSRLLLSLLYPPLKINAIDLLEVSRKLNVIHISAISHILLNIHTRPLLTEKIPFNNISKYQYYLP